MKKFIYLIGLIVSIGFVACNQDNDSKIDQIENVEVTFNTALTSGSSSGDLTKATGSTYDRNGAPTEVTGIIITSKNLTYTSFADITEEFPFETPDDPSTDSPIAMNVKPGTNEFEAKSTTSNSAGTWVEKEFTTRHTVTDPTITDPLAAKAEHYSGLLKTAHPIYTEYTDTVSADIGFDPALNNVDLDMTCQLGRVNIVFEAVQDFNYQVTLTLYSDDGSGTPTLVDTQVAALDDYANVSGIVFNNTNIVKDTYITMKVEKKLAAETTWTEIPNSINIPTQPGVNLTQLIYYDGDALETTGFAINFTAVADDVDNYIEITD